MKLSFKFIVNSIGIGFLFASGYVLAATSFPQTTQMFYVKSNISGTNALGIDINENFTVTKAGGDLSSKLAYVVGTTDQSGVGGSVRFSFAVNMVSYVCFADPLMIPLRLDDQGNVFTDLTSYPLTLRPSFGAKPCPTATLVVTGDSKAKSGYMLTVD